MVTERRSIGVLDLQGGSQEHLDHLRRIGIPAKAVKHAHEISGLRGLIIPGGESTCLARLMTRFGLNTVIVHEYQRGMKLWGTCAGSILLAKDIVGETPYLALIDIAVERNAFGSQLNSFSCDVEVPRIAPGPIPITFIRAPMITRIGEGVEALLAMDNYVAAAEDENVLITVFHPELTPSLAFHRYFAKKCGFDVSENLGQNADTLWTTTSWMQVSRHGNH